MDSYLKAILKKSMLRQNEEKRNTVLIVDFLNLFYRSYMAVKEFDSEGYHCGGIVGSIVSLNSVITSFLPNKVYVCHEGHGSAEKKRKIVPEYKTGRVGPKLSPFKDEEYLKEDPEVNFQRQLAETKKLLLLLPVINLEEDGLEADDLISFLHGFHPNDFKVIASSDRDFLQLSDKNTLCYNPLNKKYMNYTFIKDSWGISPPNLAQSRAIIGDKSDGLTGVKGVAEKTLSKLFKFVLEDKAYDLDHFFDWAKTNINENKLYKAVLENEEKIRKNFLLMDLKSSRPSHNVANLIHFIQNFKTEFDYNQLSKVLIEKYRMTKTSIFYLINTFNRLV